MVRSELIIGVQDVVQSSDWYQKLLGCHSGHGGESFEASTDDDGANTEVNTAS